MGPRTELADTLSDTIIPHLTMPSRDSEWEIWVEQTRVALDNNIRTVTSNRLGHKGRKSGFVSSIEDVKERFFDKLVRDSRYHGSGTVTILFSDLVASTAIGRALGQEAYAPFRSLHAQHVRAGVQSRGVYVKNTGDGHLCWFTRSRNALDAAHVIQRSAADAREHDDRFPLVRISLHTGEPLWADDDALDPHGTAVDFAARLNALATPGKILMSDTAYQIVKEARPGLHAERRECDAREFGTCTAWEVAA
jgi:class 3 adenylate cyclase